VFVVLRGRYKGSALSEKGWYIRDLVNRVSREVVGRKLNPQDLRASVITAEYTGYVNPKIIQLKARHRSEKTTQRYNHADEAMVAKYIENGTIFSDDTESLCPVKPGVGKSKRGCINTLPGFIPSTLNEEEEDNSSFSFSVTFFICVIDCHWFLQPSLGVAGSSDRPDAFFSYPAPLQDSFYLGGCFC
jgi:hypothetical protein